MRFVVHEPLYTHVQNGTCWQACTPFQDQCSNENQVYECGKSCLDGCWFVVHVAGVFFFFVVAKNHLASAAWGSRSKYLIIKWKIQSKNYSVCGQPSEQINGWTKGGFYIENDQMLTEIPTKYLEIVKLNVSEWWLKCT